MCQDDIDQNNAILLFHLCCPFSCAELNDLTTISVQNCNVYFSEPYRSEACRFPVLNYKIWFTSEIEHLLRNILFGELQFSYLHISSFRSLTTRPPWIFRA
jgi:hypothetical protein